MPGPIFVRPGWERGPPARSGGACGRAVRAPVSRALNRDRYRDMLSGFLCHHQGTENTEVQPEDTGSTASQIRASLALSADRF